MQFSLPGMLFEILFTKTFIHYILHRLKYVIRKMEFSFMTEFSDSKSSWILFLRSALGYKNLLSLISFQPLESAVIFAMLSYRF